MTLHLPRAASWLLLVISVVGALVWMTGAPAAAHASLLSTDPDDGAVIAQAPSQVVFTFNEPVRLDQDAVHAFKADGSDWNVSAQAEDNRLVVTPSEDPGTGTVVVAWKVTSSDGHEVGGALNFSIGAPTAGVPSASGTAGTPASVTALRIAAGVLAGLGLVISLGLSLTRRPGRMSDLAWNVGLGTALLLAPLHQLADQGRGLSGLGDWLTWLDGLTRGSSLLLLAAYAVAAAARTVPRRIIGTFISVPALVLLSGAAYAWPPTNNAPADSTAASDTAPAPSTVSGDLGDKGTATITVTRGAGRTVTLELQLTDTKGQPLTPFATPTLTVSNNQLTLGDATLTDTGPGGYRAELTIPTDGDWTASVSVRTSKFDNPIATVPFTIG